MKRVLLMTIVLCINIIQATNISIAHSNTNVKITGSYEINNSKSRIIQGREYIQIKELEEAVLGQKGEAEIPGYSKFVSLPNSGNYVLEKLNYDYEEIILDKKIAPVGWEDNVSIDLEYYNSDEWFPKELVVISQPNIMRGARFSQITIAMAQYNPALNTLRILKNIDADFRLDTTIHKNPLQAARNTRTAPFANISQKTITGFEQTRAGNGGSYLFICPDNMVNQLQTLKSHKEKLGYQVRISSLSETGATNNEIKSYLQNAYDTWENPPEYVILIGDVSGNIVVPTFYVEGSYISPNVASDHPYTLLEGDDYFPDIMIGRISVQTTMQLATIVQKIINYENNPYQGNWIKKALVISFKEDNDWHLDSPSETKMAVREKLLNFNYSGVDTFIYPYQSGQSQLENMINTGYSFVNFRGSGGPAYWASHFGYTFFDIENINNLNNGFMLPFVTSMTCGTGDFASAQYTTNFGETWLVAGTPSNPKGAIGLIGPSEYSTVTEWNNANDMGIYQGITHEQLYRGGEMLLRGKMALYNNYPNNLDWGGTNDSAQFYFYVYNLLGDPGLAVWTDTPKEITLQMNYDMITGENFVTASIVTEQSDKSGFKIAITNADSLIAVGYTNESGEANIPVALSNGNYQVTASKYGYVPTTEDLSVNEGDIIALQNYSFSDDIISGGTVDVACSIVNFSNNLVAGINVELISHDSYLQVISGALSIEQLNSLETAERSFQFNIGNEWKNGIEKELFLKINSEFGESVFLIPLEMKSPELVVSEFIVENDDNSLLPNSMDNVSIQLYNTSSVGTSQFSAVLSSQNEKTSVTMGNSNYGTIQNGSLGINQTPFQVSVNDVMEGELAKYSLQIFQNDEMVSEIDYTIPIGILSEKSPTYSEFGYYAIECRDEGNFEAPAYNWIEIDPQYGGEGILLQPDYSQFDGFIGIVDLPFDFQYFGVTYDEISICSNGYVAMGESELIFFRNRIIPSGVGVPAMIAPFWDNLDGGNIYTFYDAENHYFVIEWSEFHNVYNPSSTETFQLILYDSEFYPKSLNVGTFLFQYKEIHNIDAGDNFATVGMINYFQNDGILMTFANIYPNTTHQLQNETAILFAAQENFTVPMLSIEQSSITTILPKNSETTKQIVLKNVSSGNQELIYRIELSNFRKGKEPRKNGSRSIENDRIMLFTPQYYSAHPINIMFYLVHNSPDNEAVSGLKINFPEGFVVNSADDIGSLNWNGETGDGAEVTWGFGNGELYTQTAPQVFNVHVTIDESCTQPEEISWLIQGDGSGEEPHEVDGIETIVPSANSYIWITYPDEDNVMVYALQDSIKWQSYGDMDELNLYWKSEHFSDWEIVSSNLENSGYHEFTVPGPLAEHCRLKLSSLSGETYDTTSEFRITALNTTYPENNTIMIYSTNDSLKWVDTGGLENIDIYLSTNNGMDWYMFAANVENTGSYEFNVPGPPSNQCMFKLSSPDGLIYNMSPIFEITDAPIDWFYPDKYSGTIAGNESAFLDVTINSYQLETGFYSAYMIISTNFGQKISIPIELEVSNNFPTSSNLYSNYPNPFSISTNLSFSLPQHAQKATITIYNVKGQKIRTINYSSESFQMTHSVIWDGRDSQNKKVGSGIYFYNLQVGDKKIGTRKCILLK